MTLMRLTTAEIHKHCHSSISCELVSITVVLLQLIGVHDGAFCLHQLYDDLMRSWIDCICTH